MAENALSEKLDRTHVGRLLFDLIRLPSFSEEQFGPITKKISSELSRAGFSVEYDRDSACIIGRKKAAGASKTILLSAHYDTVVPVEGWSVNPLIPKMAGGKVYGLGASDCKGGLASILAAARTAKPANNLIVLISGHEDVKKETGGKLRSGVSIYLEKHKLRADLGIVTEATAKEGVMGILVGHFGKVAVRMSAKGVAAHGAHPEQGVNAIEKLIEAYNRIRKGIKLEVFIFNGKKYKDTLNFGVIKGGEAVNIVPSSCTAEFEHRFHPGKDIEAVKGKLLQICDITGVKVEWLFEFPPFVINCPKYVLDACAEIFGHAPEIRVTQGGTDANFLNAHGIPTLVIGPGETKTIHRADEYVELDKVLECARILARIIEKKM